MGWEVLGAASPLVAVIALMLACRWGSAKAGAAGLAIAVSAGALGFGLTPGVFLASQVRGLALSFYILYIIWTGLFLYQLLSGVGAVAQLETATLAVVPEKRSAALLYAWCLSGVLEGIAGFGVPLAAVAPLLLVLGVAPAVAVAVVAIGHAWSVTFGDMGVVYQALLTVVRTPASAITIPAALLLGAVCVASGWVVAWMLGLHSTKTTVRVVAVGLLMALVQAGLALIGLAPLAAFGAGIVGLVVGMRLLGRPLSGSSAQLRRAAAGMAPYLLVAALLAVPSLSPGVSKALERPVTAIPVPEVVTRTGWVTPAGTTKPLSWLLHPGTVMAATAILTAGVYWRLGRLDEPLLRQVGSRTWAVAAPTSLGVMAMIGVAMVMDHTGMTQGLARAAGNALGAAYPALSALVGVLGALATGSNTSSNVLFGPLQESMAAVINVKAGWLLAAQTAGGALGSMVAPAKLVLGCAAVGLVGREGEVLRRTGPVAIALALLVGGMALALA